MADLNGDIYKPSNMVFADPATQYAAGETAGAQNRLRNLTASQLALENMSDQQKWDDIQAQRKSLQDAVTPDANGNNVLDPNKAVSNLMSSNAGMATALQEHLEQHGLQETVNKNEALKSYFANTLPGQYDDATQAMVKRGYLKPGQMPKVYNENVMQKGVTATLSADDQLKQIAGQRTRATEIAKGFLDQGIYPGDDLLAKAGISPDSVSVQNGGKGSAVPLKPGQKPAAGPYSGLKMGDTMPTGKKDIAAMKTGSDELGKRMASQDYQTSSADLYTSNKLGSLLDPYAGDFNKVPTDKQPYIAAEAAKLAKGASGTEAETEGMAPKDILNLIAKGKNYVFSKPEPSNNAEYYKDLWEYKNDLKKGAINNIQGHHQYAENMAAASGASPVSLNNFKKANAQVLNKLSGPASPQPPKMVKVTLSDGTQGSIPENNLKALQKRDPGLKVNQ